MSPIANCKRLSNKNAPLPLGEGPGAEAQPWSVRAYWSSKNRSVPLLRRSSALHLVPRLRLGTCSYLTLLALRQAVARLGEKCGLAIIIIALGSILVGCAQKAEIAKSSPTEKNLARSQVERGPVRVIAEVKPPKPLLSDEPVLTLTIESEPGVEVQKPPFGTALGSFLIRDFHESLPKMHDGREIIQQKYTLEPTKTGRLLIDPITVVFTDLRPNGDQKTHTVQTEALTVEVGSILGERAPSLAELHPPVGPLALPSSWSIAVWMLGALFVILAAAGLWLWRRTKRKTAVAEITLSPGEVALMDLDKLLASGLDGMDVKLFYVQLTGIVRRYIEQTTGIRAPEQTTEEFLHQIAREHV
ncbi:MAG: hypothetical protein ACWGMZ_10240, partial [Thermoguttaceae bacterium]